MVILMSREDSGGDIRMPGDLWAIPVGNRSAEESRAVIQTFGGSRAHAGEPDSSGGVLVEEQGAILQGFRAPGAVERAIRGAGSVRAGMLMLILVVRPIWR